MNKGKLGISLAAYSVFAFVCCLFGQTLLCALVLAMVMIVEKDELTTRSCMQALFLTFLRGILFLCGATVMAFSYVLYEITYSRVLGFFVGLLSFVPAVASIIAFVFCILGLVNVCKGREANVPIVSGLAMRAFGCVPQKQQYAPQGGYPQQPSMQMPYSAPANQPYTQTQAPTPQPPYATHMGQPYGPTPTTSPVPPTYTPAAPAAEEPPATNNPPHPPEEPLV